MADQDWQSTMKKLLAIVKDYAAGFAGDNGNQANPDGAGRFAEEIQEAEALLTPPRRVYFINELVRTKDWGFIPCIAVEGEKGFYRTNWNYGPDMKQAQKLVDRLNERLGYTPDEAYLVVLSTL